MQVLKRELLTFEQRRLGSRSASLSAESLTLQLFGYITLVKDGRSLGRLHAVNYWKGGTTGGKFNGIRIHPSSGRSKDLQYARLLLVFSATLCDGIVHELALVRHHDVVTQRRTVSGVDCSDAYLKETGFSVILLTDVEDGWTLLPDYRHGFRGATAELDRYVASNYLL